MNDRIEISGGADLYRVTVDGGSEQGRGIRINGSGSRGRVEIRETVIKNTKIANYGGGLYIYNPSGQPTVISGLTIENTKITGSPGSVYDSYDRGGGAYINVTGALSIEDTDIRGTESIGRGGGLFITNPLGQPTVISRLTIENTKATGVYNWSGYGSGGGAGIEVTGALSLEGIEIRETEADGSGGGLYVWNSSGQPTVISGLVIEESKTIGYGGNGGGAYINVRGALSLEGINITETEAAGGSTGGHGGGLYIYSSSNHNFETGISDPYPPTVISGLTIENTKTTASGGGAYIDVSGALSLEDIEITETEAGGTGGGLYIEAHATTITDLTIKNTKATGSSSRGGGAYIAGEELTLEDIHITGTEAAGGTGGQGGGLYINQSYTAGNTTISNLHITDAKATYRSGGMGYYSPSTSPSSLTIANSVFTNCRSDNYGGALSLSGNSIRIQDSRFLNCYAYNNLKIGEISGNGIVLSGCTFTNDDDLDSSYGTVNTGTIMEHLRLGPLTSTGSGTALIENCIFTELESNQTAEGGYYISIGTGGTVSIMGTFPLTVKSTRFNFKPGVRLGGIRAYRGFELDDVSARDFNTNWYMIEMYNNYPYRIKSNCLIDPNCTATSGYSLYQVWSGAAITYVP
jgi:hypothetical protein